MGNATGKLTPCFWDAGEISRRHDIAVVLGGNNPFDDGLGHSFCYIRPDQCGCSTTTTSYSTNSDATITSGTTAAACTTFRIISGASISANTSTPLSTTLLDPSTSSSTATTVDRASSFESSPSFSSFPLQPIPRTLVSSGPILRNSGSLLGSGHFERGFLSGPIERGHMSGPIDRNPSITFSGSLENRGGSGIGARQVQGTLAAAQGSTSSTSSSVKSKNKLRKWNSIKGIKDAILGLISSPKSGKSVKGSEWERKLEGRSSDASYGKSSSTSATTNLSRQVSVAEEEEEEDHGVGGDEEIPSSMESQNLQWAQGKAGEDRVHVVISEEHGWVFVGIYDGFNGPDAPDFLLSNLYSAVHKELKGLMMNGKSESGDEDVDERPTTSSCCSSDEERDSAASTKQKHKKIWSTKTNWGIPELDQEEEEKRKKKMGTKRMSNQNKKQQKDANSSSDFIKPWDVLKALSEALRKTEEAYLEIADNMVFENPELSLMGSCVLVMLMKGEDIYVMNVGDSRAVLGQKAEPDTCFEKASKELERINKKESSSNSGSSMIIKKDAFVKTFDNDLFDDLPNITAIQFTMDHNTHVKEEVERIQNEHPDDPCAVMNDRVKGSLKVTRAFGAGFLKKPKWNDALLEMFRIDYVGTSPYLTCSPSLHHHKLGPRDKFLILSSDGLYQYFTNEEAVSQVETFTASNPEGDPAQHLVEELLFRAAKKAGMDFLELLDIPQGERRRYHDDVSIIVISLEGGIWRSSM